MNHFGTQIDTSYLIGFIVILVFCFLCICAGILWWIANPFEHKGLWAFLEGAVIGTVGSLVFLGIFALVAFPPFPGVYNEYQPESGIVKTINQRFIASDTQGGGTTERFAVQYTNGRVFGCDDTRCSVLKAGQWVTLMCEKEFQFNGTPGYACNFGGYGKNG